MTIYETGHQIRGRKLMVEIPEGAGEHELAAIKMHLTQLFEAYLGQWFIRDPVLRGPLGGTGSPGNIQVGPLTGINRPPPFDPGNEPHGKAQP